MIIRHIHSPTHPSNSDTINTVSNINCSTVTGKYRKTSCAAPQGPKELSMHTAGIPLLYRYKEQVW